MKKHPKIGYGILKDVKSEFLIEQKGEHFDPCLVDLFVGNIERVRIVYDAYKEVSKQSRDDNKLDYEVGRLRRFFCY